MCEVLLQLPSDDIFFELLPYVGVVPLSNFDDALDVSVDRFYKHIFELHFFSP